MAVACVCACVRACVWPGWLPTARCIDRRKWKYDADKQQLVCELNGFALDTDFMCTDFEAPVSYHILDVGLDVVLRKA